MLPLNVTHQAWFLAPTQSWKGTEKLSVLKTVQIQVWNSISVLSLEYWGVSEEYLLVGIKIDCCGGDVPMVCVWYQLLAARHREQSPAGLCLRTRENKANCHQSNNHHKHNWIICIFPWLYEILQLSRHEAIQTMSTDCDWLSFI